jgi:hypothetical protein
MTGHGAGGLKRSGVEGLMQPSPAREPLRAHARVHASNAPPPRPSTLLRRPRSIHDEKVLQRALRAFDLTGEHCLLPHVHEDEQVRIGQREHRTIQPPQRAVGPGEQFSQPGVEDERRVRRQRRRNVRRIARLLPDVSPCAFRGCARLRHEGRFLEYGARNAPYDRQRLAWRQSTVLVMGSKAVAGPQSGQIPAG